MPLSPGISRLMRKSLTVSKLDAAKRQLEAFIQMYFGSGDPVAMHTLAAAAYEIIRDLNRQRGGDQMLHDTIFENARPENRGVLRAKLREAQNFFKHADRDHDATLDFNPDLSEFIALDSCKKYTEITGENPTLFQVFNGWMMMSHQEIFNLPEDHRAELISAAETFLPTGKAAYFKDMLPIVMKRNVTAA